MLLESTMTKINLRKIQVTLGSRGMDVTQRRQIRKLANHMVSTHRKQRVTRKLGRDINTKS